jgi:hypothetical protein
MERLGSAWLRWVAFTARPLDTRPLALVRIGAALCILLDLARVAGLGLVPVLFRSWEHGGLSTFVDDALWIDRLSSPWAGHIAFWVALICMGCVVLGVLSRPATLLGVLAYAQLGHLYPPGDRAVDRILRCVLLILVLSQAHRRYSLGGGPRVEIGSAWPSDLIKVLLTCVYMSAGISKLMSTPHWLGLGTWPVLYRILGDPFSARMDPTWLNPFYMAFCRFGSLMTVVVECGAILILTRLAPWWALVAVLMHLGIAAMMNLGMFAWGMLAIYPILLWPLWVRWRERNERS